MGRMHAAGVCVETVGGRLLVDLNECGKEQTGVVERRSYRLDKVLKCLKCFYRCK